MSIVAYGYGRILADLLFDIPRGLEIVLGLGPDITVDPDIMITVIPDDVNMEVIPGIDISRGV